MHSSIIEVISFAIKEPVHFLFIFFPFLYGCKFNITDRNKNKEKISLSHPKIKCKNSQPEKLFYAPQNNYNEQFQSFQGLMKTKVHKSLIWYG
jgi:hypothetical protein